METAPLTLINSADLAPLAPVIALVLTGILVLGAELFLGRSRERFLPVLSLAGLGAAFLLLHTVGRPDFDGVEVFSGCLRFDRLTFITTNIILGISAFLIALSPGYLLTRRIPAGEYYALTVFATMAMIALASSNELLTLFLNLEVLSFSLYILTGIERQNLRSTEAAFKYFLTGSYAAAFLLFGITLIYGATGTTFFSEISQVLGAEEGAESLAQPLGGPLRHPSFMMAGLALMMVGIGFKLTFAPFHMYAPDVYAGAPTPVAAAVATGSKVGAFVAFFSFFRLFAEWTELPVSGVYILGGLSVLSIVVGNVGALLQPNIKRLLAYSGVAHGGYVLVPFVAVMGRPDLLETMETALGYYLGAYALMTALAFGVLIALGPRGEGDLARLSGLARRSPFLAAAMALALVSLTGIPLTVGFVGKVYLFSVAVEAELYALAIFAVLASVASAAYYLRVIVRMYMEDAPEGDGEPLSVDMTNTALLLAASAGVVIFAVFPSWILMD